MPRYSRGTVSLHTGRPIRRRVNPRELHRLRVIRAAVTRHILRYGTMRGFRMPRMWYPRANPYRRR